MGVIAMSAPRLKRPMPRISSSAAPPNTRSSCLEMFTQGVMARRKTIRLTGTTETRDSLSFSRRDRQRSLDRGLDCAIAQR